MNLTHSHRISWLVAGTALLGFALNVAPAAAELPPSAYADMQRDAPEALKIEITAVNTRATRNQQGKTFHVSAEATVEEVTRSASGLKVGQTIHLNYTHFVSREPIAGPSQTPIVKAGESYPAFLEAGEKPNTYAPAAGGYTFEIVDAEPTSDEETM